MNTGLEHACQLLIAAAQSKNFVPCGVIFNLIDSFSSTEKLERINSVLSSCFLRAIRVKHKGVYCLSLVDATEQPTEYYKWLRDALTSNSLTRLNKERGAYILIRILLYTSQQECEIEHLLDILSCTAKPPSWQERQSDEAADIREAWRETLEEFAVKEWLLKNETKLSSASDMAQALICEKELSKFLTDLKNGSE